MWVQIVLPILTPICVEIVRRLGARRMSGPRVSVTCFSVGDEYGHRKWNIKVQCEETPQWARWLLDAASSTILDATIRVKVYNKLDVRNWEETLHLKAFELLWSDNIPGERTEIEHLLNDGPSLSRAKRIRITKQDPRISALVMKKVGESPFILDPESYRSGLPGQGRLNTNLALLEEFVLVVNIRHANDPIGKVFCFRLTKTGDRLEEFNMTLLPKSETDHFLKLVRPHFEQ